MPVTRFTLVLMLHCRYEHHQEGLTRCPGFYIIAGANIQPAIFVVIPGRAWNYVLHTHGLAVEPISRGEILLSKELHW
jgi:hypothetical protein